MNGSARATRASALAATVGLVAVAPLVLSSYLLSLASLVFIAALLAASVNLLAGPLGLMSIGHAGIAAAAGYGVAWATTHQLGVGEQLLLAVVITLAVSVVFGLTTMRTTGIVFLMITLALGVTIFGLLTKLTSVTGGRNGLTDIARPALVSSGPAFFYLTAVVLGGALLAMDVIWRSPFGLTMRGVRDSVSRMSSLGYSVATIRFVAILASGLFAGAAGVLAVWHNEFTSPSSADFAHSAFAVVMVIVGGAGYLLGPIAGAAVVIGIQHWLSSYVERWPSLLGLVFIAVVVFAPTGIVGGLDGFGRRLRRGRTAPARSPPLVMGGVDAGPAVVPARPPDAPASLAEKEEET